MTSTASSPRRSGIVHAALALGGFAIGTTEFATMSVLPLVARDFHVDLPTASRAISAYAMGVVVGAPLLAVGGARLSRRTMLIVLMAWVAVAKGAYKAPWLEYGTKPHFISVDAADSGGRTVGRINRLNKTADREGSLRIGGNFVGPVVHHPGAKETKFFRPAIDSQWEAAVAAASAYLARRMTAGDLNRPAPADEDQA